ncbi:Molybdopterin synthase catalytic subunit [Cardamine amara subsp. amara]|uniref:Molybdopterin synthase catalytic subunit n=1 Tax=Cardamine amara subsp. amara TaxID=228776 RepID=A0ABD0Z962_CARAN
MSAEEKNLIEILEEGHKVDVVKYMDYVSAPQAGAIATFSGTTRDMFEGKTVLELRYEAYVPMAMRCLSSICTTARSTWDIHKIAVAHRLGPVPVGESSVFIAVSSVHRADGLDACKFLIDELKASVPIWKKEVYTNGEIWKENSEFMEKRLELAEKRVSLGKKPVVQEHRRGCCGSKVRVEEEEEHKDITGDNNSS